MMRAVIFDFDYTLADSSVGVIDCIRYAQERMGLPLAGTEAIRRTIGLSVPDTLARLNGEPSRPRSDEFGRLFLERADVVMADNTVVFDAVPAVFEALASSRIACAIASTKPRFRIEAILERDGLLSWVQAIVGAEDVTRHKPDPTCLQAAVARLGIDASHVLYVGDSLTDAETARRAGIDLVAVLTGTTAADAFAEYEPRAVLASVAQLPSWLGLPVTREIVDG